MKDVLENKGLSVGAVQRQPVDTQDDPAASNVLVVEEEMPKRTAPKVSHGRGRKGRRGPQAAASNRTSDSTRDPERPAFDS